MGLFLRIFTKWSVSLALLLFVVGGVPTTMEDALRAYMNGDCVRAAKLWGLKAEQGNAEARYRLGRMFAEGICARGRQDDGIRLIASAASQGYAAAQTEMGVRYLLGDGVPVNYDAAVDWLGRARANPDGAMGSPVDAVGGNQWPGSAGGTGALMGPAAQAAPVVASSAMAELAEPGAVEPVAVSVAATPAATPKKFTS